MKVYLAAPNNSNHCAEALGDSLFVLESFVYFQEWERNLINDDFLIDSGAFTFISKNKGGVNWEEYVHRYADFINANRIKLFFELDIDALVGLKEVERLRGLLERLTGRQCIPVWHKSRGEDCFFQLARDYGYIAIGGIAKKEIKRREFPYLPRLIDKAHELGCKIHGLGFTNIKAMSYCNFDSVDSSSWTGGRRYGTLFEYKDGGIVQHYRQNIIDYKLADIHNLREWIKFQHYALDHL